MIVGPITLLICPIWGPLNERRSPHVRAEVLPLFPPTDGRFVPTQPAAPIWLPPTAAAPPSGRPHSGISALAPETGAARATAPVTTTSARMRLRIDLTRLLLPVAC